MTKAIVAQHLQYAMQIDHPKNIFSQTKIRNKLREKLIIFVEYAEDGDDDKNDVDGNFEW